MGDTTKLTLRLPSRDVAYIKAYARTHGITVTEVIDRFLRRMRAMDEHSPSHELEEVTGILPPDIDAEAEYRDHLVRKHGG